MARPVQTIFNQGVSFKQSIAALNVYLPLYTLTGSNPDNPYQETMDAMNNDSQVSRWLLFLYVVSCMIYYMETLWDIFLGEVEALVKQAKVAKSQWYAALAKNFQTGFTMVLDPNSYEYSYTDTTSAAAIAARIVTQVSANEVVTNVGGVNIGVEVIKIAQTVSPGVLGPIVNPQLAEFTTYIQRAKPAGVKTSIISMDADKVACTTTIYFDGTLDPTAFATAALAAINAFLTTGILFDGQLFLKGYNEPNTGEWRPGWLDAIAAIPGCMGVEEDNLQAAPANTGIFTSIPFNYQPASGYFVLAALGTNAGQANITFTPKS